MGTLARNGLNKICSTEAFSTNFYQKHSLSGKSSWTSPNYKASLIDSAALSKRQTLKYPLIHGICFFDETF